jgi:hypothetical protein
VRQRADGGHQPERNRQIVMADFLRQVGGRQINGDAARRQRQPRGDQGGAHALLGFGDRFIGRGIYTLQTKLKLSSILSQYNWQEVQMAEKLEAEFGGQSKYEVAHRIAINILKAEGKDLKDRKLYLNTIAQAIVALSGAQQ